MAGPFTFPSAHAGGLVFMNILQGHRHSATALSRGAVYVGGRYIVPLELLNPPACAQQPTPKGLMITMATPPPTEQHTRAVVAQTRHATRAAIDGLTSLLYEIHKGYAGWEEHPLEATRLALIQASDEQGNFLAVLQTPTIERTQS
tara:strand:+ start:12462 stop:12899 length:438 start_codon:yes stop_codon:yes gene_type:complete